jgi:predicted nucleic acid-binding protein
VKAYIDTGIFIDYLSARGPVGPYLRKTNRRGRSPAQLGAGAEKCFMLLAKKHEALTSSLTFYEGEEAMYGELRASTSGAAYADKFIIPAARVTVRQILMVIESFNIEIVELAGETVLAQCGNIKLETEGVRAADALHVTTALLHDADLILSTDSGILNLDGKLKTPGGNYLRCLDSDAALPLLNA